MELGFSTRTLKLWYYRYKDSPYYGLSFLGLIFVVTFILIWKLVYPQITNWFSVNAEIERTRVRIATIDANISALSAMSDATVAQNLEIAAHALPTEKDFVGILVSISQAAQSSGVSLDDYSVVIGDLTETLKAKQAISSLQLRLTLGGGITRVKNFISEIQTSVPLAEASQIQSKQNGSEVILLFYYKPLKEITISDTKPLPKLSKEKQDLLTTLDEWWEKTKNSSSFVDLGV